jgi:hypothetical protein
MQASLVSCHCHCHCQGGGLCPVWRHGCPQTQGAQGTPLPAMTYRDGNVGDASSLSLFAESFLSAASRNGSSDATPAAGVVLPGCRSLSGVSLGQDSVSQPPQSILSASMKAPRARQAKQNSKQLPPPKDESQTTWNRLSRKNKISD